MTGRTKIGAADDKATVSTRVETLLASELGNQTAFAAMAAPARLELIRRVLVLLLSIVLKRVVK